MGPPVPSGRPGTLPDEPVVSGRNMVTRAGPAEGSVISVSHTERTHAHCVSAPVCAAAIPSVDPLDVKYLALHTPTVKPLGSHSHPCTLHEVRSDSDRATQPPWSLSGYATPLAILLSLIHI